MEVQVKQFSGFWVVNVVNNGEVVRTWTGKDSNHSWFRECMRNAKEMEKTLDGVIFFWYNSRITSLFFWRC